MFSNQYIQERIKKSDMLREKNINPYPANIEAGTSLSEFISKYAYVCDLDADEKKDDTQSVTLIGRIKLMRIMGKASFAKIEDKDGAAQIYFNRDDLPEGYYNEVVKRLFEVGDLISVTGYPFVTQTGELTLHCTQMSMVSKSISPLPEKFHGLTDQEARYRKRYLDMIMNPDVTSIFTKRSKIISLIRKFFEEHDFLEVETPMMHPIPGGANAKPFITHHNSLGVDRYLRIAPELYLKRLIVGGMDAVFEINRNFRNEGMDHTHNPEFTSIEFYWAYHNYKDLMKLTEDMFDYLFDNLGMSRDGEYGEMKIDYSTPFAKVPYVDALVEIGGVPREIATDRQKAFDYLKEHKVEVDKNLSLGYLQSELFDEFVEKKLINPTFITDYPIDISPLSRRSDDDQSIAERFELFIGGSEIANGFNELNDPIDQLGRFEAQVQTKEQTDDDEAMHMDQDFVNALSYGMAPTAGEGIGIDRLVMMLTNQQSIKDVLLFPAMKPEPKKTETNSEDCCKKCGNCNQDELKPAKKGKGFFCQDAAECGARAKNKK